eukprot:COSAG01_NODE_1676_length_9521_cov_726.849926_1_plen_93_part_10
MEVANRVVWSSCPHTHNQHCWQHTVENPLQKFFFPVILTGLPTLGAATEYGVTGHGGVTERIVQGWGGEGAAEDAGGVVAAAGAAAAAAAAAA